MNATRFRHPSFLAAACYLAMSATTAADSIVLFNTGVDGSGHLLASGSVDPHYSLIEAPSPSLTSAFASDEIPGTYIPNGSASKWVGPGTNLDVSFPGGLYVYQTTFDLTGLNPLTAAISGQFASDNAGEILLNGVDTGISAPNQYHSFQPFTITHGFVSGLNTLDFEVTNEVDTPTGLRVQLSGAANPMGEPTPEPSSFVLLGAGIALLAGGAKVLRAFRRQPGPQAGGRPGLAGAAISLVAFVASGAGLGGTA